MENYFARCGFLSDRSITSITGLERLKHCIQQLGIIKSADTQPLKIFLALACRFVSDASHASRQWRVVIDAAI